MKAIPYSIHEIKGNVILSLALNDEPVLPQNNAAEIQADHQPVNVENYPENIG